MLMGGVYMTHFNTQLVEVEEERAGAIMAACQRSQGLCILRHPLQDAGHELKLVGSSARVQPPRNALPQEQGAMTLTKDNTYTIKHRMFPRSDAKT